MDPLTSLFDHGFDDCNEMPEILPPEIEEGNIEYKLKLVNPSDYRFEHLVTQMKWRLQEGQGEAIYEIGVEDNGMLAGLTETEMQASLHTLSRMANRLSADITVLREKIVESDDGSGSRKVAEILVRKVPESQQFIDMRLAVLGNVDAGKSTLLGVLTQGELDNGRGRARLNLFRHLHEIQSGRTSSISHEIIGFDSQGNVINYSESRTVEEICENSTKLITLIDLCGHHKYLKTTIFGLTGYAPDFAMLVVSANTGIAGTTKEHLGYALALGVPIFVVVSKVDQCGPRLLDRTVRQLEKLLKSPGCKKVPFRVDTEDDAITAAASFRSERVETKPKSQAQTSRKRKSETKIDAVAAGSSSVPSSRSVSSYFLKKHHSSSSTLLQNSSSSEKAINMKRAPVKTPMSTTVSRMQKSSSFTQTPLPISTLSQKSMLSQKLRSVEHKLSSGTPKPTSVTQKSSSFNHSSLFVEQKQSSVSQSSLGKESLLLTKKNSDVSSSPTPQKLSLSSSSQIVSTANSSASSLPRKQVEAQSSFTPSQKPSSSSQNIPPCLAGSSDITEAQSVSTLWSSASSESICPIFLTSSVTGEKLDLLTKFLNVLPPSYNPTEREQIIQQHPEMQVDEIYYIGGVGVVAGGTLLRGTIKENDSLLVGPTDDGEFLNCSVQSLQRNRMPCRTVIAGQAACVSLGQFEECQIRRGMVLLSPQLSPVACLEFEADIYLLFHANYICKGFQTVIHVENVCQTAKIIKMNKGCIQTNEKAVVTFRFNNRPEFLRTGARLLFREGRTKGMGEITRITPVDLPAR